MTKPVIDQIIDDAERNLSRDEAQMEALRERFLTKPPDHVDTEALAQLSAPPSPRKKRTMQTKIVVKTRREGEAIRRALDDPQTRALVVTMGELLALPTDRSRERVIRFVIDKLDEETGGLIP